MRRTTEPIPTPTCHAPVSWFGRALSVPFVTLIWAYRCTLSPFLGGQCRFHPTCSRYALEAYRVHGPWLGTRLTVRRLLRCHPFSKGGYDPVPINMPPVGRLGRADTLDDLPRRPRCDADAPAGPALEGPLP